MRKKIKEVLRESINTNKPIIYSCVLLDEKSHDLLLSTFSGKIPEGWKEFAHHMTITLGELKDKGELGKEVTLTVTHIGWTDKVIAVLVDGYHSKNIYPHVTLAVNPDGGKPKMSNDITNWEKVKPFVITGIVTEI